MALSDQESSSILEEMIAKRKKREAERTASDLSSTKETDTTAMRGLEVKRAELNKMKLDPGGKDQLTEINKKADSIMKARQEGKINSREFVGAIGDIQKQANDFSWDLHVQQKGDNPGDIIEEDGIRKMRTMEGGLEPIAFTPEYVAKNIVPVGDSGNMLVPISPKDGYKIINRSNWERDAEQERGAIKEMHQEITDTFKVLSEEKMKSKEVFDNTTGKSAGFEPLTIEELNDLSIEAGDVVSKRWMQAKDVLKRVMDGGQKENSLSSIREETIDPFKKEKEIRELEKAIAQAKGKGLNPTPTQSPVPEMGTTAPGFMGMPMSTGDRFKGAGGSLADKAQTVLPEQAIGFSGQQPFQAPEGAPPSVQNQQDADAWKKAQREAGDPAAAQAKADTPSLFGSTQPDAQGVYQTEDMQNVDPQDWRFPFVSRGYQLPVVDTSKSFGSTIASAGGLQRVAAAASKLEFDTKFKDAQEGTVVDLPDGRRYVKADGQFMQVPASLLGDARESQTMLDKDGNEIMDPSTGEPVPSALRQLEQSGQAIENPYSSQFKGFGGRESAAGERSPFTTAELDSAKESSFQQWYADRAKKTGVSPNPDDPEHYYDYRAAFEAGDEPEWNAEDQSYHWPSQHKLEGHPRMVLDGVNTKTGRTVGLGRKTESPARDTVQQDTDARLENWYKDPEVRSKVEKAVTIQRGDKDALQRLNDGDAFTIEGTDSTYIKDGADYVRLSNTKGSWARTRIQNWENDPEMFKLVLRAKPLQPGQSLSGLPEGAAVKQGRFVYVIVGGQPVKVPRSNAMNQPGRI
jgi:hypothetical protein